MATTYGVLVQGFGLMGECKNPVRAAYDWDTQEDAQREADRYTAEYGTATEVVTLPR